LSLHFACCKMGRISFFLLITSFFDGEIAHHGNQPYREHEIFYFYLGT
jgi:hypothetical protein